MSITTLFRNEKLLKTICESKGCNIAGTASFCQIGLGVYGAVEGGVFCLNNSTLPSASNNFRSDIAHLLGRENLQ